MEGRSALVVVGVDDSAGGRAALRFALQDAARRGARVDVVAAFRMPDPNVWGPEGAVIAGRVEQTPAQVHGAVRTRTQEIVDEALAEPAVAERAVAGPPPVTVLAVAGSAGEVLVHAAHTADLLVVGSRGHGAVRSAVLGSVGLHCVLHAPCPVTVVRPAHDREPVAARP
ncbi:universal stress protein [Pseudonocardia sp. KRD-184]|uniref:Universal stress protein n=1 Tax=Pseudonocardia oceani TaxID=2792013 RepID=A0ABS6UIK8_9PSEU|nr:universal stress protein [Pseudonocardia oceani]MBW0092640.1 universal stress protein [Pseudonocardia oceani]MBW0098841.1 universal stress protein [Pseudonocardia oceani]MBW0111347.1 universal stress protein [Pseudonocardia oceani]MBW0122071.1 universal stress protein [Pseudonocardia oceani]MBW0131743.1 universal stress protein [Pseudonocardia oceani]